VLDSHIKVAIYSFLVTHACCIAAGVSRAFSRVCKFVHTLKTAWAINTKLGTHTL